MAFNLIRNSRVFYTSNVDATTGAVKTTGFTTANTREIQVLEGFSFSQNTTSETVTLNEAGAAPVRGQRSFNTALDPADFSFTTYMRPQDGGTNITAEECVLWNAMFSATEVGTTGTLHQAGAFVPGQNYTIVSLDNSAGGATTSFTSIGASANTVGTRFTATGVGTGTGSARVTTQAWVDGPVTANLIVANSDKHQLLAFGMIIVVDETTFVIDNCVFNKLAAPTVQYIVPKQVPMRKLINTDLEYFANNANNLTNLDGNYFGRDVRADAINVTVTDFTPTGTDLSYTYTPTLYSNYTADSSKVVEPGRYATSMMDHIYFDDGKGPRVIDCNSASSFVLTASLTTTDQYVSPVISDDGTSVYVIKYSINNMSLANTDITVTSGNTVGVTANYTSTPPAVTISAPTAIGGTQAYATANLVYNPATTGYYVDKINVTTPGSGYIETPTITISANSYGNSATAIVSGETLYCIIKCGYNEFKSNDTTHSCIPTIGSFT